MFFKKTALGVAALALPLSLLGAPAAMASQQSKPDRADEPRVSIKSDKIRAEKGDDVKVEINYKCDTGHKNRFATADRGKERGDQGELKVTLKQRHVRYSGTTDVDCDGEWAKTWVELERDSGKLESGDATVKAKLIDPQDEKTTDEQDVEVKIKKSGRHH